MLTPYEFIEEILAHPDDDTPRLIFADWLEERGDPRGEFIRVQCEIARLTKPSLRRGAMYDSPHDAQRSVRRAADLPRYKMLLARQLELLMAHCKTWTEFLGSQVSGVIFDRGFITGLCTTADTFACQAPTWYRLAAIHQLRIREGRLAALRDTPCLCHIHTLELDRYPPFGEGEMILLAACPALQNLRRLRLGSSVADAVAEALLASPHLGKLTILEELNTMSVPLRNALSARLKENERRLKSNA